MMVVRGGEPVDAEVDGTIVMMSLRQGKYYGLDGVGSRIWQLIASPRKVSELCEALGTEFDVEPAVCERDVIEFLEELAREGLIEVRNEKAG
jgi:hypothetical protein